MLSSIHYLFIQQLWTLHYDLQSLMNRLMNTLKCPQIGLQLQWVINPLNAAGVVKTTCFMAALMQHKCVCDVIKTQADAN